MNIDEKLETVIKSVINNLDGLTNIKQIDYIDDLSIDSITFIELMIALENEFDIEIPDNILLAENFNCFENIKKHLIDIIYKKVGQTYEQN